MSAYLCLTGLPIGIFGGHRHLEFIGNMKLFDLTAVGSSVDFLFARGFLLTG